MIIRTLVILALVAAILGGTGYFAYEFYLKPQKLDQEEKKLADLPPPAPPPDPSLAAFDALGAVVNEDSPEAQAALAGFLSSYPDSPKAAEARAALGRANVAILLSPAPSPENTPYTVVSGDSLVRIASKFKSGAELIYRANHLSTINLKIGQQLMVPKLDSSIVVDREGKTVTLLNGGVFVKEYPTLSLKLPGSLGKAPVETKVTDKVAMKGSVRAAFGTKDFEGSDRWLMLGVSGVVLRGAPAAPLVPPSDAPTATPQATPSPGDSPATVADATPVPMPPGIILAPTDAEEIFVLTKRGTPVTIK